MMRALSDFAAISAVPQVALITLIVPAIRSTSWVKKLYRGLRRAASRFDVALFGGETAAARDPERHFNNSRLGKSYRMDHSGPRGRCFATNNANCRNVKRPPQPAIKFLYPRCRFLWPARSV